LTKAFELVTGGKASSHSPKKQIYDEQTGRGAPIEPLLKYFGCTPEHGLDLNRGHVIFEKTKNGSSNQCHAISRLGNSWAENFYRSKNVIGIKEFMV
jgi:hypothetical protein